MYRMAVLAMSLEGQIEGLDIARAVSMCLVHDLAEAIVGDITPYCGISDEEKFDRENRVLITLSFVFNLLKAKLAEAVLSFDSESVLAFEWHFYCSLNP
ncbi:unnamed protein product [Cylicostephanus goldi]|uniref:HD domain-containing protein n=1 Tax=Cylicostephanus goldi TaxID=71465 RepID=A0A3P7N4L0_CYLGO|nr:unnamed protein product [Cylicostephanus goldi]